MKPKRFFIMEIWKDVIGFEGFYKVSSLGRVMTIQKVRPNKIIKQNKTGHKHENYYAYNLHRGVKKWTVKAHRLVAIHFIPNPENKPQVNHIDGDSSNNIADNLEWVTALENACHKSKSKYTGVSFHVKTNKWRSRISINKKELHLGLFKTPEEAYEARRKYELNNKIINRYL